MTCFRPLQAVRIDSSENPIRVIDRTQALNLRSKGFSLLPLPCGQCIGCRLAYSKGWAVRCTHESQLYEFNSFVTLTYNDKFNDLNGGALNYEHFTLFMKRLRKAIDTKYSDYAFLSDSEQGLRFFMCGEYGDKSFRPHYHALFFNLDFDDKVLHTVRNGFKLFTSESLSSFWTDPVTRESYGYVVLGSLTFQSCGYVSRYCTKKVLDGAKLLHINKDTGEYLPAEKTNMSRKPGIAYEWFKRFSKGVYPEDKVVLGNGLICKPPRYYDTQLEQVDPALFEAIKQSRIDFAITPKQLANSTTERLMVRELVQLGKVKLLPRSL